MDHPDGHGLVRTRSFDEEPKQPRNIPNVIEHALQNVDDTKSAAPQDGEDQGSIKPTILNRNDVKYLFSGAPHFMLEKGRHNHWYPHVLFPWDNSLPIQDLWDREPMRHESFTLATLHAHLPVPSNLPPLRGDDHGDNRAAQQQPRTRTKEEWKYEDGVKRSTLDLGIFEVPNMLSMNGKEPGAVGFRHFLELATADAVRYKRAVPKGDNLDPHLLSSMPLTEAFDTLSHLKDPYSLCSQNIGAVLDRHKFLCEGPSAWKRLGIRDAPVKDIVERIEELSNFRLEVLRRHPREPTVEKKIITILDKQTPESLHNQLYSKFLFPPPKGWSRHQHEDLKGQVEVLTRVLAARGAWIDLSLPEWRVRVGQILWEMPPHADGDCMDCLKDSNVKPEENKKMKHSNTGSALNSGLEKKWLLIQLLLAGELVMRLDAFVQLAILQHSKEITVTAQDIRELDKLRHGKVNWDLLFFQRISDQLIFEYAPRTLASSSSSTSNPPPATSSQQPPSTSQTAAKQHGLRSKLGSISHHLPLHLTNPARSAQESAATALSLSDVWDCVTIVPRRPERQLKGLVKFAEAIGWPDQETLEARIRSKVHREETEAAKVLTSESVRLAYNVPIKNGEPSRLLNKKEAYCRNLSHRYVVLHGEESNTTNNQESSIGGWLSRSWLTGLVMPGECINQFLMATILETDPKALHTLDSVGNLYGGFSYGDGNNDWSWWSTKCIVGRVLAALSGSKVCMGWVRVNMTPEEVDKQEKETVLNNKNRWFSIEGVLEPLQTNTRICQGTRLTIESNPLGKGRVAGDTFTIPIDDGVSHSNSEFHVKTTRIMLSRQEAPAEGLSEEAAKRVFTADQASISFDINTTAPNTKSVVFPLTYNVMFISSYTCRPPRGSITHRSEHADAHDRGHEENTDHKNSSSRTGHLPGHPLHKSYKYKYVPIEDLRPDTHPPIVTFQTTSYDSKKESSPNVNHGDQKHDEYASAQADTKQEDEELEPMWIIDARSSCHDKDKEVYARAWCAAVGVHALIGRAGRTCLACCVREARAIGVGVVIRV